ncbi:MAG: AzlD domain-containing protein [Pseudomonadota bacterium]
MTPLPPQTVLAETVLAKSGLPETAMPDTVLAVAVILAMAVITGGSRMAGFFLMARITITPRFEAFLTSLAGAVLVAMITPPAINGDAAMRAALIAAATVMALTRKAALAMMMGLIAAAAWRFAL